MKYGWMLAGSALVGGAIAIAGVSGPASEEGVPLSVRLTVARRIALSEGGGRFDAINPNNERHAKPPGPGLSFGFIQWTQASGHLGELLGRMRTRNPRVFDTLVGGSALAEELLRVTKAGSLAPVGGEVLWSATWIPRFRALGADPGFMDVQLEMAADGIHMRKAIETAKATYTLSPRGLALAFDRCVQHGEYGTARLGAALGKVWSEVGWPSYPDRLSAFARKAVGQISSTYQSAAQRRVDGILNDPNLSDAAIA